MHGYGVKRKNAELHSLRCDMRLKLDVAEMFRNDVMCVRTPGHGTCLPVQQHHMHTQTHVRPPPASSVCSYFPHNLDFRGRAYPIPPHLNHMGSDISRYVVKLACALCTACMMYPTELSFLESGRAV